MSVDFFFNSSQSVVLNETSTISHTGATPLAVWIVVAVAAFALLTLSFAYALRNQQGAVNTSRVAFSLLGVPISGFAAWLSLKIDVPTGVGATSVVFDNVSNVYAVSMHTIYEGGLTPYIFVITGAFCLANLVYTLLQPEIIKPDTSEMGGGAQGAPARTRAEQGRRQTEDDVK